LLWKDCTAATFVCSIRKRAMQRVSGHESGKPPAPYWTWSGIQSDGQARFMS